MSNKTFFKMRVTVLDAPSAETERTFLSDVRKIEHFLDDIRCYDVEKIDNYASAPSRRPSFIFTGYNYQTIETWPLRNMCKNTILQVKLYARCGSIEEKAVINSSRFSYHWRDVEIYSMDSIGRVTDECEDVLYDSLEDMNKELGTDYKQTDFNEYGNLKVGGYDWDI